MESTMNVMFQLDKKLHRTLKLYCALNGISMRSYVEEKLRAALAQDSPGVEQRAQAQYEASLDDLPVTSDPEA